MVSQIQRRPLGPPRRGRKNTRNRERCCFWKEVSIFRQYTANYQTVCKIIQRWWSRFFCLLGLSLVLHPKNPMVPTVRQLALFLKCMILDLTRTGSEKLFWFWGGQDLTPYYLFEDAVHFHQTCKTACDGHNPEFYPKYIKTVWRLISECTS